MRIPILLLPLFLAGCTSCGAAERPSSEPASAATAEVDRGSQHPIARGPETVPETGLERHGTRLTEASRALGRHPAPLEAAASWVRALASATHAPPEDAAPLMGAAAPLFVEQPCADAFAALAASRGGDQTPMIEACRAAYCEQLEQTAACSGEPRDVRVAIGLLASILSRDHGLPVTDETTRFIAWTLAAYAMTGRSETAPGPDAIQLDVEYGDDDAAALLIAVGDSPVSWDLSRPLPESLQSALGAGDSATVVAPANSLPVTVALGRLAEISERPLSFRLYEPPPPADPLETQPAGSPQWGGLVDEGGDGFMDTRPVLVALIGQRDALARCQREAGSPAGQMDVQLSISLDGAITGVESLQDTTESEALRACVARTVAALPPFVPGPEVGAFTVTYPLLFTQR